MLQSRFFVCTAMILVAVMTRLIPHPMNFSPILAIALFSGAHFVNKRDSILVPVLAWFLSDLILGFHSLQPLIYGLAALMAMAGWYLQKNSSATRVLGFSALGSVVFFLVTNFFVWLTSGIYNLDMTGFIQCYVLAIPFFQNSLLGDMFFSVALFGGFHLLERNGFVSPAYTISKN
jgi:hypothetical protein